MAKNKFKLSKRQMKGWFKLVFLIVLILWISFGYQYLQETFGTAKNGFIITSIILIVAIIIGIFKPKFITNQIRSRL